MAWEGRNSYDAHLCFFLVEYFPETLFRDRGSLFLRVTVMHFIVIHSAGMESVPFGDRHIRGCFLRAMATTIVMATGLSLSLTPFEVKKIFEPCK